MTDTDLERLHAWSGSIVLQYKAPLWVWIGPQGPQRTPMMGFHKQVKPGGLFRAIEELKRCPHENSIGVTCRDFPEDAEFIMRPGLLGLVAIEGVPVS